MNAHASLIPKLVALAIIACVPLSGESFYIEIVGKILVMAIFAMSLDLLVGFTGLVSFGHAAYFGIAAYAVAILSPQYEAASLWYVLPASIGLSALAAFVIGLFVLRTKGKRVDWVSGVLSHGEQRQLEIAMVLATDAQVLLLDEPLAGMGSEESASMVEVLKRLRQTRGILLVEHDMDAVFAVADMITVMVNGQLLECGPPAQIKASVAVQQAYLGTEDSFHV
ncbi:hypothetical protein CGK74_15015 [Thauera propionica]|uniref:Uncharacterized protein n=1 Tax=Thauera propionica TaxID=2019431 RepID=A0A235EVE2_9RHOO|nr:ATP-binding cassette domain-containing protein [Thauera propionica]OYD53012.1 hypothetical protein CGK74_15015 [Thauera propionica]TMW74209.1 ATP-binding cassette domain-containing protein [Thauera sp. UPWRP]